MEIFKEYGNNRSGDFMKVPFYVENKNGAVFKIDMMTETPCGSVQIYCNNSCCGGSYQEATDFKLTKGEVAKSHREASVILHSLLLNKPFPYRTNKEMSRENTLIQLEKILAKRCKTVANETEADHLLIGAQRTIGHIENWWQLTEQDDWVTGNFDKDLYVFSLAESQKLTTIENIDAIIEKNNDDTIRIVPELSDLMLRLVTGPKNRLSVGNIHKYMDRVEYLIDGLSTTLYLTRVLRNKRCNLKYR